MSQSQDSASQDYEGAMHEVKSNLDVRRLLFVVANVLVPALIMAVADALSGSNYPDPIRWLPENIIWVVGLVLAIAGTLVTLVLGRCHFGLVVNGMKLKKVIHGAATPSGLNWMGVTTNLTVLTALSAGGGIALLILYFGFPWVGALSGLVGMLFLVLYLRIAHGRANALSARLCENWQHGEISAALREEHTRMSLDATTADTSVVVTMAAALFAGSFSAMSKMGAFSTELSFGPSSALIREHSLVALSAFTLISLVLSASMVIRLRLALGEHATTLAKLRNEPDDSYRFRLTERTYCLFLIVQLLAASAALILMWTAVGSAAGMISGVAVFMVGAIRYPMRLFIEKRTIRIKE